MITFPEDSAIRFANPTVHFNGGELHPTLLWASNNMLSKIVVKAEIRSSNDIMELLLIKDAIDRMNTMKLKTRLVLPYLPYARQDRVANQGEALGVKIMCQLINNLNFDSVTIHDVHSSISLELLNNVEEISQDDLIGRIYKVNLNDIILAPDIGATKKAEKLASKYKLPMLYATKHRDTVTGKLSNPEIHYTAELTKEIVRERVRCGGSIVVVDDICDAGGTFLALGEVLVQDSILYRDRYQHSETEIGYMGAKLFVTHGIFANNAKEKLSTYYQEVRAYNDWTEKQE